MTIIWRKLSSPPSIRLAVILKGVDQAEVVAVTVAKSPKFGINLSPRRSVYHARAMMQFLSRPSQDWPDI